MVDMQIQYMQQKYSHPMPDSIHEGGLYAALHHDGYWYRYVVGPYLTWHLEIQPPGLRAAGTNLS